MDFKVGQGVSRGMLIMWKSCMFTLKFSFRGEGYVVICVDWEDICYYIVNIYSSCNLDNKRRLWRDLSAFIQKFMLGDRCIGGI